MSAEVTPPVRRASSPRPRQLWAPRLRTSRTEIVVWTVRSISRKIVRDKKILAELSRPSRRPGREPCGPRSDTAPRVRQPNDNRPVFADVGSRCVGS
ncbi:hypothetical protein EVAR_43060_1 [Eumeta japonica]|uniref:Uncharacterized protein n=1 Tax=Eumeta variegata TaxID=151549 RepID=A0A4C1WUU3_EUMVA|nr:hypothetical protein EVAR_43060_1 [Eumeta japonica]